MSARSARNLRPLELARRMVATDALFWYAERALPIFRPLIGGLYVFDRAPEQEALEASLERTLAVVPRLRERVVEAPGHLGLPEWIEDAHFDLTYHVRRMSLPDPGDLRQLLDLTATWLATPLDRERPLWEAYWVDGLERGRAALFLKLHHCLVDGVGSIALLEALTQSSPDPHPPRPRRPRRRRPGASPDLSQRLTRLVRDQGRDTLRLARQAAALPVRAILHPSASATTLARTARGLRGVVEDLARPLVRDPLARSTSGLSRRLDVLQISLERLRKIKAPLDATLNDLVLAVLAGAVARYHRERRVRVEVLNCMVPMNLRGRDERDQLGNRVGTFFIGLPVAESDPVRRLDRILAQTQAAKTDKRGAAAPFLVQTLTAIPGPVLGWLARHSLGRVNVACTNIPGLPDLRYLGTARIESVYPFASVVEGTPLVVALLSYAGSMDVGIDTDPEAIPDPHRIAELLEASLAEYEALASRATAGARAPR